MLPGSRALMRLLRRASEPPFPRNARARLRMQVEEIEPRILHSADLIPGAVLTAEALPMEIRLIETPSPSPPQASAQESRTRELVIVDTAATGYQALVDDIVAQADGERRFEILILDASSDGITQVSEALSALSGLDAVHVVSHGAAGQVHFGSSVLDLAA